jgi:hypothetical protein
MKQKITAIIAVITIVSLLLSGCGGAPSAEQISQQALAPQTQTTTTTTQAQAFVRTPLKLPAPIKIDKSTPKFLEEALSKKQPLLIFIYKQNERLSETVRENIKKALNLNGSHKLIFMALNSEDPAQMRGIVDGLMVTSVPFIALIDEKGMIVREFSGYVDEGTLMQAIYDLVGGSPEVGATTETTVP